VQLDVPTELLSSVQLAALHMNRQPRFVPVTDTDSLIKLMDDSTGVIQRRLSNGIRVNYKVLCLPRILSVPLVFQMCRLFEAIVYDGYLQFGLTSSMK
jgi:hypothetical protein